MPLYERCRVFVLTPDQLRLYVHLTVNASSSLQLLGLPWVNASVRASNSYTEAILPSYGHFG